MDQVRLGNSGLHVSRLCLGMMSYYNGTPSRPWMLDEKARGVHKLDLHAAASYSWMRPPRRSRRCTLVSGVEGSLRAMATPSGSGV
jgi:hypothetical protein